MCQDTGTAIINGYRGKIYLQILLMKRVIEVYLIAIKIIILDFLSYISMFDEKNTNNNLPAEINLYATEGDEYKFTFIQKGGGSANKAFYINKQKQFKSKDLKFI